MPANFRNYFDQQLARSHRNVGLLAVFGGLESHLRSKRSEVRILSGVPASRSNSNHLGFSADSSAISRPAVFHGFSDDSDTQLTSSLAAGQTVIRGLVDVCNRVLRRLAPVFFSGALAPRPVLSAGGRALETPGGVR